MVSILQLSVSQALVKHNLHSFANQNTAVWHSELMKPTSRGKGLSVELAINIFGVMLSYWVDFGMSYVSNQAQFRFPIALQILFALVTIALMAFLPESPRWVCFFLPCLPTHF